MQLTFPSDSALPRNAPHPPQLHFPSVGRAEQSRGEGSAKPKLARRLSGNEVRPVRSSDVLFDLFGSLSAAWHGIAWHGKGAGRMAPTARGGALCSLNVSVFGRGKGHGGHGPQKLVSKYPRARAQGSRTKRTVGGGWGGGGGVGRREPGV